MFESLLTQFDLTCPLISDHSQINSRRASRVRTSASLPRPRLTGRSLKHSRAPGTLLPRVFTFSITAPPSQPPASPSGACSAALANATGTRYGTLIARKIQEVQRQQQSAGALHARTARGGEGEQQQQQQQSAAGAPRSTRAWTTTARCVTPIPKESLR